MIVVLWLGLCQVTRLKRYIYSILMEIDFSTFNNKEMVF